MSVVNECRKGDLMYNIIESKGEQNKANNILYKKRKIEVGEELEFVDAYLDEKYKGTPHAWQVMFKCKDGYVGNAPQFYFVTADEWNDLKEYFNEYYHKIKNMN